MNPEQLEGMVKYGVIWTREFKRTSDYLSMIHDIEFMEWLKKQDIKYLEDPISDKRSTLYIEKDKIDILKAKRKEIREKDYRDTCELYLAEPQPRCVLLPWTR